MEATAVGALGCLCVLLIILDVGIGIFGIRWDSYPLILHLHVDGNLEGGVEKLQIALKQQSKRDVILLGVTLLKLADTARKRGNRLCICDVKNGKLTEIMLPGPTQR